MSDPFLGEIRMFAGPYAPFNWNFCDGTLVSISQNDALYQLLGTTYGGDGTNTFALPNLQSRVPIHQGTSTGSSYILGQVGGAENVTLVTANLPAHSHALSYARTGQVWEPTTATIPASATSTQQANINVYGPPPPDTSLNPNMIMLDGQSLPHSNIQPYLAINYIICMAGIFPPHP